MPHCSNRTLLSKSVLTVNEKNSSFKATFTDFKMTECVWQAHDGQQPDEDITY